MSKPIRILSSLRALITMVAIMCLSVSAMADAPQVTKFYPDASTPPATVKSNTKIYVYFDSPLISCNYAVYQNDNLLGETTGKPSTVGGKTCTCDIWKEAFANKIEAGDFDFVVKSVTYNADGATVTYEYTDNQPKVTYHFNGKPAVIDKETKLPENKLLSYYPEDATGGQMILEFSKPMAPGYSVVLEYGNPDQSNNHASMEVKSTLDGNVITIDFRGVLRSVDAMVPDHHFTDDSGNETDPPTTIGLTVSKLKSTDGEDAMPVTIEPSGKERVLTGLVNYVLTYEDISFPTPAISSVMFYNSANPGEKFESIGASTDMMAIAIQGAEYIASAEVAIEVNGETYTVSNYKDVNGTWDVELPADVRKAGETDMTVSIVNVTYTENDGNNHVIAPYSFSNVPVVTGQSTLAEVIALPAGSPFELTASDIKVTMVNEDRGYVFIEDATAAVQVTSDIPLTQGTAINGTLVGVYYGDSMLNIDYANSTYHAVPTELTPAVITIEEAMLESNYNRLVKFTTASGSTFTADEGCIMVDEQLPAILDLLDDYEIPSGILSVAGILWYSVEMKTCMLIVRDSEDITYDQTQSINSIVSQGNSVNDIYTINGVKVRTAGESVQGLQPGIYVAGKQKMLVK